MFDRTWLLLEFRLRPILAREHCQWSQCATQAPGLEENHILPWNTEDGSCALGICDCCNEIGRNRWCTLVGLWPRTLDGDKSDPNSLIFVHGLDTWGWHNGPGKTAHNILW